MSDFELEGTRDNDELIMWLRENLDDALYFLEKARSELRKEDPDLMNAWGYTENVAEFMEEINDKFNEEM